MLILPLLEAVATGRDQGWTAEQWFAHEGLSILWFLVSFGIIASFWVSHEKLFRHIENPSRLLLVLNFVWLLAIVAFPVISSMLTLPGEGILPKALYIGAMAVCGWSLTGMLVLVLRDPAISGDLPRPDLRLVVASVAGAILWGVALAAGLLIPGGVGYFALFVLWLMPLVTRVVRRVLVRRGYPTEVSAGT